MVTVGLAVAQDPLSSYGEAAAAAAPMSGLDMLRMSVPGEPGEDYPVLAAVPDTAFTCDGRQEGGQIPINKKVKNSTRSQQTKLYLNKPYQDKKINKYFWYLLWSKYTSQLHRPILVYNDFAI